MGCGLQIVPNWCSLALIWTSGGQWVRWQAARGYLAVCNGQITRWLADLHLQPGESPRISYRNGMQLPDCMPQEDGGVRAVHRAVISQGSFSSHEL